MKAVSCSTFTDTVVWAEYNHLGPPQQGRALPALGSGHRGLHLYRQHRRNETARLCPWYMT